MRKPEPSGKQITTALPGTVYDPRARALSQIAQPDPALLKATTAPTDAEIQGFRRHRDQLRRNVSLTSPRVEGTYPPPGGVGAGVMLKDGCFTFSNDTAVYWYALAPRTLGGRTEPLLYLTSSNCAAKGCEALVSYQLDGEAVFRIWDWATPVQPNGSQFIFGVTRGNWGTHALAYQVNDFAFDALYICNRTLKRGPTRWRNEVLLFNGATMTFDLVWHYDFDWSPVETEKYLSWGPIIETFPEPNTNYGQTNPIGYAEALTVRDGYEYQFSSANSYMRYDNHGFDVEALFPNHTLVAD